MPADAPTAAPPPTADETLAAVRLNLAAGVGPLTQRRLVGRFGSPAAVFEAPAEQWITVPGVGPKVAAGLAKVRGDSGAERELERCEKQDIRVLLRGRAGYPASLATIPDPPEVLYCRGRIEPRDALAVGVVGPRRGTLYGTQTAEKLSRELARAGVTVVSGLARGVDAAAHRAALEAGGRTLAVIAPGLTKLYPPEHVGLARDVVAAGAVLTESPLSRSPAPGLFPQRNRIISGLSCGVLIVEAARKSGALHTARHAQEQGREVFAVPGHITDPTAEGCHDLIRDGATLVRGVDDILESLGPLVERVRVDEPKPDGETPAGEVPAGKTVHTARELTLGEREREVLDCVPTEPGPQDAVLAASPLPPHQVLSTLTILEMRRFVKKLPGGMIVRMKA